MADREKVIRGLESCSQQRGGPELCEQCPYYNERFPCTNTLLLDALVLLREQEPRVMTLEELQAIETPWNRNTPPYLFVEERSAAGSRWMSWGFMHDFVRLWGTINAKNYGSKWRVWNLEPTPEQMRDTPWEGESDAD